MKQICSQAKCGLLLSTWTAALLFLNPFGVGPVAAAPSQEEQKNLVPLPLKLPAPTLRGTKGEVPSGPHIEPPPDPLTYKRRPDFLAPKGVRNVALGKTVTTSAAKIYNGTLSQITDGKKEPVDDQAVEMPKGVQWVQLDLEKNHVLYAIVLWHDHRELQVFYDVVVQAADDAEFTKNVRTLFNNDVDNSAGLGVGTDKEYFETDEGKLIDAKKIKARYLRFYSRGCNKIAWNIYQEIEVYALPGD